MADHSFTSTKHSSKSMESAGKYTGANVHGSRLNSKGDMYWRGARGGEKMKGKTSAKKSMSY